MNSSQSTFSAFSRKSSAISVSVLVCLIALTPAFAENAQEARVTRIVKDVQLVGGNAAARPAALSDSVRPGNGVRTGSDSRAELTFSDLSITRLGANTVFSFNGAGRTVDLGGGAILVEAPPNSAAIHVNTAAFSAAISGGTGLIEFHPNGISKVMVLEGQGNVTSHAGEVMTVPAGEMITLGPDGKWIKGLKFNVALVMKSSNLITDFGSLPNEQLIFEVIEQQKNDFGSGPGGEPAHDTTLDDTVSRDDAAPPGQSATPGQGPTPPVGNVPVITSPNPYVISSGTSITTDPTITTNGQTNQGVIYQGSAIDGPVSAFVFDSTSAFDTASGFDQVVQGENAAAAFKFTALQITGDPTIDTTNGPVRLALIAINGITSASPGGPITFAGLQDVLLAAQNGSVTLGPEISFSGLHSLVIYARGATSDLTLGSDISTVNSPSSHADLFAERNMTLSSTIQSDQLYAVAGGSMTINGTDTLQAPTITLNSFHDLTWDGETSDTDAGNATGNVTITAGGNINVTNDLSFTRTSLGNSEGPNLTFSAGQNATIGGIMTWVVDNSGGGNIDNGGNIAVSATGNLTVNGARGIEFDVLNGGGHIGTGGNISVSTGGDLTAEGLTALLLTGDGGAIDHGVTLNVAAGGALNLDFGSQFEISTSAQSTSNGGTIGGDALIQVTAASISTPNSNNLWFISNNDGGHIEGNATVSVNITGNASFADGTLFDIENRSVSTLSGGTIDGNAVIDFSAGNTSSGDGALTFEILNQGNGDGAGGQIGGDATITIQAANLASASSDRGDIVAQINNQGGSIANSAAINLAATGAVGSTFAGNVNFTIDNSNFGSIGGDASVTAQMASLGAGNELTFQIANELGIIGGSATVDVTVTGAGGVNLPNQATFTIDNSDATTSIQPHEVATGITGDAGVTLNVQHGGLMDDDGLEVSVDNSSNSIGGAASVSATVANAVQINAGDANFEILNSFGSIRGAASVSATAGSISANNVLAQIDNTSGSINGAATVAVNVTGDVTATNGILLQILNEGGGIGSGAGGNEVSYIAGGTTTANSLQLYVDNSNGGEIGSGGNLFLHTTGPVVLNGPLGMEVDNYAGGFLSNGGNVTAHFHGDVTDTSGSMHSFNFFVFNGGDGGAFVGPLAGGTIGTGGNINLTFDGNLATTPTMTTGSFGIEIANDTGAITDGGNITVTSGGNMTARIVSALISNSNGTITNGANITFNTTGTITSTGFTNFEVINIGGTIGNNPEINVHAGSFNVGTALVADYDNEGGSIGPGGTGAGLVNITSDGGITVGAGMWVLGTVTAGGDVDANTIGSTDITTTGNINAGSGGIVRFRFVDGNNTMPDVLHTLTATTITSQGGINFNGADATETSAAGDGGALTLNASSISFDPEGDIQGSVTLNGGMSTGEAPPGSGGTLVVNTTGNITVNNDIEATSGYQDASAEPRGNGGSVSLVSTAGLVSVNSRIEVSSNDPTPSQTPPPPIRRSDSGGTILLQSNLTTGQGITVGANAQLLSLLNDNATGPGGSITLSTMGSAITVSPGATIEADHGTITMDQSDPANPGAISIDGATLTSNTLTINGAGDVNIAQTTATTLNFSSATLGATNNINWNIASTSILPSLTSLNVTAGNALNLTGGGSGKPVALTLNLTADSTFTAGTGGINAQFVDIQYAGAALNLASGGDITANSIAFTDFTARGSVNATGAITITDDLDQGIVTAGTSINVGGNVSVSTLTAGTTITVGTTGPSGPIGGSLQASSVTAGGDITANDTDVQTITSPTGVLNLTDEIHPYVFSTDPSILAQGAMAPHVYTIDSIVAPNGIDFSGNQFGGINGYSSGGLLTINANTLTVDGSTGVGSVNFNGADAGALDFNGNVFTTVGGDGGTFIVNASGNITANNGTDITATTGNNASGDNGFFGAGGTVKLISTGGSVTVNDTIQVSSDDPTPGTTPPPPIRRSASGGTILLQSNLTTGQGITVGANAQLLSLLDTNAPGPGGSITLSTMGAAITVSPGAVIEADHGTITMDQSDPASPGAITITGANLISDSLVINAAGDVNLGMPLTFGPLGAMTALAISTNSISLSTVGAGSLDVELPGSITLNGHAQFTTSNAGASQVDGANLTLNVGGNYTNNSQTDYSLLQVTNQGHIGTGGNISVDIAGNLIATGPGSLTQSPAPGDFALLLQNTNAQIDTGGNINLTVGGNVNVNGLSVYLQNYDETANPAGRINTAGGNIDVEVTGNLNANQGVDVFLNNRGGGFIGSGGNLTFKVGGDLTMGDGMNEFVVSSRYDDVGGNTAASEIDSDVAVLVQAADISIAGDLFGSGISNRDGSQIFGNATVTWNVPGNLMIQGGAGGQGWYILNDSPVDMNGQSGLQSGGTIFGDATVTLTIGGDFSVGDDAGIVIQNQREANSMGSAGGVISGDAILSVTAANVSVGGELDAYIENQNNGSGSGSGGTIFGDAKVTVNVTGNLTTTGTSMNSGGVPGDADFLIFNYSNVAGSPGGEIDGDAAVTITAGDISVAGNFDTEIINYGGGKIAGDATIQVGTADLETNSIFSQIDNSGGQISGDATVNVTLTRDLTVSGTDTAQFNIINSGGTISGNAHVVLGAEDISAGGSLSATIDNSSGGVIEGTAIIDMNLSGDAEITNDMTVQIVGNDPSGAAAININGGNYDVGGTFRSTIDGNGTITFNSANINADVIKAGVFGPNGVLMVGGGSLSANTELKLYAPGSNGKIEFNADVSLSGGSTAAIIAANTVTIDNGVTVTIGGGIAAQVYANNRNYVGGGTGSSSTGTFAGAGAVNNPLGGQPTFDSGGVAPSTASRRTATVGQIRVNNSGQLLAMASAASGDSTVRTTARTTSRTNRSHASRQVNLNANRTVTDSRSDIRNMLANSSAPKLQ